MLSGEGNENGKKTTTIGLISKKATLHVQHTFFVHFFAVVLHDCNVKRPSLRSARRISSLLETSWLHVLWRKRRRCSCSLFFSLSLIFTCPPASRRYKISCCSSNKNVSLCFLSLALELLFSLSFALSPYFLFFSVFRYLYIPNLWT